MEFYVIRYYNIRLFQFYRMGVVEKKLNSELPTDFPVSEIITEILRLQVSFSSLAFLYLHLCSYFFATCLAVCGKYSKGNNCFIILA